MEIRFNTPFRHGPNERPSVTVVLHESGDAVKAALALREAREEGLPELMDLLARAIERETSIDTRFIDL
ncbi:hypothetical protein [Actinocorallia libanotica]|uniref:DUF1902 domain-containing protein n=1 Tax=Actinocorallia libanotica TaxID=46162 RepID=A0ABN1Q1P2_9ACTN